jgi:putative tryptophan/tyrosine transport system substrate-binding protein
MKRREFITLFGGAAAAWPLAARGQQAQSIARIGVLWHAGSEQDEAPFLGALRQGFSDLGYVEGRNLVLENRFAGEQYDRFNQLAAVHARALHLA